MPTKRADARVTEAEMDRKKKILYIAIVASVFALLAFSLFQKKPSDAIAYNRMLMGTLVEITIYEKSGVDTDHAADRAFAEIVRLERIFSSYIPDSDVSKVSAGAGGGMVPVAPEVIEALVTAIKISDLSEGAFDPTIGALAGLWGYSGEKGTVPSNTEISRALTLVDYKKIEIDPDQVGIRLSKKGMALNLGGVAKGYIVRKALDALKKEGVTRAIIHAGGDMAVFGGDIETPFSIGIQDPREKKTLGEAYLSDGAVSTSGDYERFFIKDGKRYHHILDPKTGWPAAQTMSVTIIARDHTLADGLSTAIFVLGPEKGMALIERLDSVEGVIIDKNGSVTISSGFNGKIY